VYDQEDVTMLWNQTVNTEREVTENRPDIIIKNEKEEVCILIDVAIPTQRNIVQKEGEKKMQEFMCRYKTNVDPEM
jgi:hypothetical protein